MDPYIVSICGEFVFRKALHLIVALFYIIVEHFQSSVYFSVKGHDHSGEQGLLTVPLITGEIQLRGGGGTDTKKGRKKPLD